MAGGGGSGSRMSECGTVSDRVRVAAAERRRGGVVGVAWGGARVQV